MTQVLYRATRSRRKFHNAPAVRNELERTLKSTTAPALKRKFEAVVSNWSSDVSFGTLNKINVDSIKVFVYPKGADKKVWFYVDKGTKPHPIKAVNAPFLSFIGYGTYKPKTSPIAKFGGPGVTVGGHMVSPMVVNHPGSKARKFTETITHDYQPTFRKDMNNAFRRGIRKTG